MEDQQADSGDLTADAAPTPHGKARRTRHRLPRGKLQQSADAGSETVDTGAVGDEAVADEAVADAADRDTSTTEVAEPDAEADTTVDVADTGADTVATTEAEPETDAESEASPAPAETAPRRRRRFPWRRSAAAATPAAATESLVAEGATEKAPAEESPAEETAAESDGVTAATESDGESDSPTDESDSPKDETDDSTDDGASENDQTPVVLVPHRTAGRALKVAAIAAGALFVAAAAFAGAMAQPYLADRAEAQIKVDVARTAADGITTLWTYTPEDMGALPERAGRFLTGDFAAEYRRYIDAIAESNKQAKVTNSTKVLGVGVESLTPTEASALVYTNSVATSPVTKGIPSLRYLSYRVAMELKDRQWRITKMTAVTSLDLTPRL